MKFAVRFIVPLAIIFGLIAVLLTPIVEELMIQNSARDLQLRSMLIKSTLEDSVTSLLRDGSKIALAQAKLLFEKAAEDERLLAVGICDEGDQLSVKTKHFPPNLTCTVLRKYPLNRGSVVPNYPGDTFVIISPLKGLESSEAGIKAPVSMVILHDMSFASKRSQEARNFLTLLILGLALVFSVVTILVARWSMHSWVSSVRDILHGLRNRQSDSWIKVEQREFLPILKDIKDLMRDIDRTAHEKDETFQWSAATLKEVLHKDLLGEEILVVSNRQPYIHNRRGGQIEVQSPASGLVTAVEPILRACSGVWIAHGNGTADREMVDARDRVAVPPEDPQYSIHRVWLTKEEELGYYYGFSNEGMWPLCHIAHTRPIFRKSDWEHYVAVNQKFADAVQKDAKTDEPVVFVHDYHFALLPRMLREKMPRATIITFWHIPWPNPESFGICPWREEILEGLLGSSILGFHTKYHCNNFIESVDRYLECRVDRETDSITFHGQTSDIKPYPISIEWPPRPFAQVPSVADCAMEIRERENIGTDVKIAVGIDRLDYTKGIIERFLSVERLLELDPSWIGRITFLQIAAPSRSSIETYQNFEAEVRRVAQRINTRFGSKSYEPIKLKVQHFEPKDVYRVFRAADICVVTSLHDGMNLVAKEFIASRDDEKGVLILSQFAGASRELVEALIVNPYDIEQTAQALQAALNMSETEQRERMKTLRSYVRSYNVFRWAGRMLLDAARVKKKTRFARRMSSFEEKGKIKP